VLNEVLQCQQQVGSWWQTKGGFCVLRWVKLLVTCTGAPPGGHCGPAFTTPPFLPKPNGPSGFFVPTVDRNVVGVWNFTVILMDVSNRVNDTDPHQVQIVVAAEAPRSNGTAATVAQPTMNVRRV
jgi:hypothetical protein